MVLKNINLHDLSNEEMISIQGGGDGWDVGQYIIFGIAYTCEKVRQAGEAFSEFMHDVAQATTMM